jgi:hypothetical protein
LSRSDPCHVMGHAIISGLLPGLRCACEVQGLANRFIL